MDFLDCKICQIPFDEEEHQPRHAPCGHGLCLTCLKALIKDSIFECPKCRQKNKVFAPEDLPVNFDLIDVIRAFKEMKGPLAKTTPSSVSGGSNEEICKLHRESIEHRCLQCQMWLCNGCLESHSKPMGCSTVSSTEAMESMKNKHSKDIDMLVSTFEGGTKTLLSKIQDHSEQIQKITEKRKELLEKAEQHGEEIKKIHSILDQGKDQKDVLVKSKEELCATNTPYAMMDIIEVLARMKQSLRSWCTMNLGIKSTDISLGSLKASKEMEYDYAEMVISSVKMHARLSKEQKKTYLHYFRTQSVPEASTCVPFDSLQKMIPTDVSLVFLEFSISGVVKGRVLLRLNKHLPNIREHVVKIATGQSGKSLSGGKLNQRFTTFSGSTSFDFSHIPVTIDSFVPSNKEVVGGVFGNFGLYKYLCNIYFQVRPGSHGYYSGDFRIFACVEEGLDLLLDLHKTNNKNAMISDCGIVIEID